MNYDQLHRVPQMRGTALLVGLLILAGCAHTPAKDAFVCARLMADGGPQVLVQFGFGPRADPDFVQSVDLAQTNVTVTVPSGHPSSDHPPVAPDGCVRVGLPEDGQWRIVGHLPTASDFCRGAPEHLEAELVLKVGPGRRIEDAALEPGRVISNNGTAAVRSVFSTTCLADYTISS